MARVVLAVVLIAAGVWGGIALHDASRPPEWTGPPPFVVPELKPAPRSAIPAVTRVPEDREPWLTHLSSTTDLPLRALTAYATAEVRTRSGTPACHLDWATLAGIGRAESRHGNHGESRIGTDGVASPPVIGVALDGSPGLRKVSDTDDGKLDGDPVWDRGVGPLQFLPQTWRRWGVHASGDGASPDPQNIDDAAVTAARYLCAQGGNLGTPDGWWKAVLAYNNSVGYAQDVFSNADAYARAP